MGQLSTELSLVATTAILLLDVLFYCEAHILHAKFIP